MWISLILENMFKASFENNLSVCHRGTLRGVCFHHQVQLHQNPSIPHNSLKKSIMATLRHTGLTCFEHGCQELQQSRLCIKKECLLFRITTLIKTSIKLHTKRHPFHKWYWHQYALEMEGVTSSLGFSSAMQCNAMQPNAFQNPFIWLQLLRIYLHQQY